MNKSVEELYYEPDKVNLIERLKVAIGSVIVNALFSDLQKNEEVERIGLLEQAIQAADRLNMFIDTLLHLHVVPETLSSFVDIPSVLDDEHLLYITDKWMKLNTDHVANYIEVGDAITNKPDDLSNAALRMFTEGVEGIIRSVARSLMNT